ncbi:MAG: DNA-binding protein [Bacillota bacterium]
MFDKSVLEAITDIDSLADMLRAAYSIEEWQTMIYVADKLYSTIRERYDRNQYEQAQGKPESGTNLKRSIAFYFGFSMTAKGIALQKLGKQAEARDCVEKYAELGWIKGLDSEGDKDVIHFKNIAKANTYVLDLLDGNFDVLPEYVQFIHGCEEEELLPGIITILEAALAHNKNVDWALAEFESDLNALDGEYETDVNIRYYIDHLYLLALYNCRNGNFFNALNIATRGLRISDRLRDDTGYKKLNALFVSFKGQATLEQAEDYDELNKLILGRLVQNEKGVLYDGNSIVFSR